MKRVALVFALLLGGCAEKANEPSQPAIAEAWQARCGSCHARVEPHTRTHAQLEDAFERHKTRTHLSPDEWKALEDFLASDSGTAQVSPQGRPPEGYGTASIARR